MDAMQNFDLSLFHSYDSSWERTFFDERTGGFLVTSLMRIGEAFKSKNNRLVFLKERQMCIKLATFGFQVEHLYEIPGLSSPDIGIRRHGSYAKIRGKTAELKQLSSSNRVYKEGINARYRKKADLLIIEFTKQAPKIAREIGRLSDKGIHGYYFFSDDKCYTSF